MYINNFVRSTISAITNIESKSNKIKSNLSGIIVGCYNTIVSFINPILNKNINQIGLRKSISGFENEINLVENKKTSLNKEEIKSDEVINNKFAYVLRKLKSDEIKESVINDIVESLERDTTLDKDTVTKFKNELNINTKNIVFQGDKNSLNKSKNSFFQSMLETILNADEKIKVKFHSIDSYKFFLLENINNAIDNILYRD
ncbi:hypothetical protein [Proteus hauseri]|uniref:hypothetical protein n=1 Tax=Proteus hauseri TaxID=183417 RepID=UPI0032D9C7B5